MFESTRLRFREMDETDFDLFYGLYSDQNVMKFAYLDRLTTKEAAEEAFHSVLMDQKDPKKGTQYVAVLKDKNAPVGVVDYFIILDHEKSSIFEIGYFIGPEYWGQGFATEMGRAIIDYLFENFNIHKITASCNNQNKNSESVMKKLGMNREGVFRKVRYKDGRWDDEIKYGLLKEDWIKSRIE